jgi:hypothetical protein
MREHVVLPCLSAPVSRVRCTVATLGATVLLPSVAVWPPTHGATWWRSMSREGLTKTAWTRSPECHQVQTTAPSADTDIPARRILVDLLLE